jgi:cellulose biosynthesis protein BcsQ
MDSESRGEIITFYSYKGGTGRTMALANVACILAERQRRRGGRGVLMIDWDLDAPGLHRYFNAPPSENDLHHWADPEESGPGLIDLFLHLEKAVAELQEGRAGRTAGLKGEALARQVMSRVPLKEHIGSTPVEGLSLIKAGRFDPQHPDEYAERVGQFNWEKLYNRAPHLFRVFAETLARDYAYVLIDSRTGVTDIGGISTMLLPEKLVVVFTPNAQSITGGLHLIRRATEYRRQSADLRPLLVFPLVSRVEANEPDLRHDWRFGDPGRHVPGYQQAFERLLSEVYEKDAAGVRLRRYFDEIQIQQVPRYAYGEAVAVLVEKTDDRFSLRRSYRTFADKLVGVRVPWEGDAEVGSPAPAETAERTRLRRWWNRSARFRSRPRVRRALSWAAVLLVLLALPGVYWWAEQRGERRAALQAEREKAAAREQLRKAEADLAHAIRYRAWLQQRIATLSLPADERIERIEELEKTNAALQREVRSLQAVRNRLETEAAGFWLRWGLSRP